MLLEFLADILKTKVKNETRKLAVNVTTTYYFVSVDHAGKT